MIGRPRKTGLDYFELDCQLDEKVRLIQAEFGLKGFAVVVKLFQKIYGELGYYCEWRTDNLLLFASEQGSDCGKDLISEIVSACVRRGIFSEDLLAKYQILTSPGIQKRYLNAVSKREQVEMKKEYLLVNVGLNYKNVVINSISSARNSISSAGNSQSRVEKSRVEKSREKNNSAAKARRQDAIAMIEERGFSGPLEGAVKEWVSYKVEKRQEYKPTGLKSLLSQIEGKANEYGDAAVEDLIRECMANNWQGIIWDKITRTRERRGQDGRRDAGGYDWDNL